MINLIQRIISILIIDTFSIFSFSLCKLPPHPPLKDDHSNAINNKIIPLPYSQILDTFGSTVFFGSDNQNQFKRINLCKPYTWFTKESFDKSSSNSYQFIQNYTLDFSFTTVIAEQSTEDVLVNDSVIKQFPFFLINNSDYFTIRYGSLGMAHLFDDNDYSFVHRLHKQGDISMLAFGFQPINDKNGVFYLGGLPTDIKNNTYTAHCDVKHNDTNWSCSLSAVYIDHYDSYNDTNVSYVYSNGNYSYFQSAESKIFAPRDFIDFLGETVFKSLIQDKECFLHESPSFKMLFCNIIDLKFSTLKFVFNGYAFEIDINDLFYCNENRCEFEMLSNKWNGKNWIFGTSFLKHFNSEFDYEQNKVLFYSKIKFVYLGRDAMYLYPKTLLLMINCVIIVLILLYNLIVLVKLKKYPVYNE